MASSSSNSSISTSTQYHVIHGTIPTQAGVPGHEKTVVEMEQAKTPVAIPDRSLAVIQYLVRLDDAQRQAPLYAACQDGRDDVVASLLAAGAKPDAMYKTFTPMHQASGKGAY